jgi:hypothetical protein
VRQCDVGAPKARRQIAGGVGECALLVVVGSAVGFVGAGASDVDEVVGDDAEPNPVLHPSSPLYRLRVRPCRRLLTLMRPSQPVRHFCPLRNQRFFCSALRTALLVARLGMQTRLTPRFFAAASFLLE